MRKSRLSSDQPQSSNPSAVTVPPPPKTPEHGTTSSTSDLPKATGKSSSQATSERSPQAPLTGRVSSSNNRSTSATIKNAGVLIDHADELPPWDRTVDVFWNRQKLTQDKKEFDAELSFQQNIGRLASQSTAGLTDTGTTAPSNDQKQEQKPPTTPSMPSVPSTTPNEQSPSVSSSFESTATLVSTPSTRRKENAEARYFTLPDRVRFMIAKYVVGSYDNDKAIRLNSPFFFDPVWPVNPINRPGERFYSTDYFDSPQLALWQLEAYTSVCFAMRVDILATFFLMRRFHVVYSPFVTANTQPAAVFFMKRFGPFMTWITLEVDLSKLAGHWHPASARLDIAATLGRIRPLVDDFVEAQLTRRGTGTTIQSLVVLVRRYYGTRPATTTPNKPNKRNPPIPYCADTHLPAVLDPLKKLGSVLDSLCIVGASKLFAGRLLAAIWGKDRPPQWDRAAVDRHCGFRTPSKGYPFLPGQRSALDYGPQGGGVHVVRHEADPRRWRGAYGCVLSRDVVVTKLQTTGAVQCFKLSIPNGGVKYIGPEPKSSVVTVAAVASAAAAVPSSSSRERSGAGAKNINTNTITISSSTSITPDNNAGSGSAIAALAKAAGRTSALGTFAKDDPDADAAADQQRLALIGRSRKENTSTPDVAPASASGAESSTIKMSSKPSEVTGLYSAVAATSFDAASSERISKARRNWADIDAGANRGNSKAFTLASSHPARSKPVGKSYAFTKRGYSQAPSDSEADFPPLSTPKFTRGGRSGQDADLPSLSPSTPTRGGGSEGAASVWNRKPTAVISPSSSSPSASSSAPSSPSSSRIPVFKKQATTPPPSSTTQPQQCHTIGVASGRGIAQGGHGRGKLSMSVPSPPLTNIFIRRPLSITQHAPRRRKSVVNPAKGDSADASASQGGRHGQSLSVDADNIQNKGNRENDDEGDQGKDKNERKRGGSMQRSFSRLVKKASGLSFVKNKG
ncbi:hypothetical protein B0T17DRAFT_220423 [Bombardia bombarda]|uniref:Uncharacterized protein n=1 Tax=Bombardia bombarda TaxID=252184 RepID=A0AA39XAM7_9PEZI|nr:hypothetical protein B0T17DRAFT_220423 [Bombardia bombarda]